MYRYAVFGRLRNLKSGAAPHPFRGGAPILKVPRGGWGRAAIPQIFVRGERLQDATSKN